MDGPIFGSGHDLKISDGCHLTADSYADICSSYNVESETKMERNQ